MTARTAGITQGIDNFFKGKIAIFFGVVQGTVDLCNPVADGQLRGNMPLHHQVVYEKTHQKLVTAFTVGTGYAYANLRLPRHPKQQVLQHGKQYGKTADALRPGKIFQGLRLPGRQGEVLKTGTTGGTGRL